MRQIVLDTETTGLDPAQGHRIIEIGALELIDRRLTGREFHRYLRPDRPIDPEAAKVHGLTNERLANEPEFAAVADELCAFLSDAELLIHNAAFDVGFLDAEFARLPQPRTVAALCRITDTLALARERHPGQKNSLDALCKRYGVDASGRQLHGALLDTRLLTEVYLAMTGGQVTLAFAAPDVADTAQNADAADFDTLDLPIVVATAAETAAHEALLARIRKTSNGRCLWTRGGLTQDEAPCAD